MAGLGEKNSIVIAGRAGIYKGYIRSKRFEELRTISVEIIAEYTDLEFIKIRNLFAQGTGYQTPKADVRGVVFKDGKILMVKEKQHDKWSLPGGVVMLAYHHQRMW
ncbi:hypothetical protein KP78_02930 [Jeotgalibacillus soli]|uniref:NUDIX hydrolase n=1 Tax=Jeotgalibacillus soli TaxID=889306 RepID=A0A0C2W7A8_9BACL|nr:hypothetical protein KP78_02930 [Jeotgalibacillus soli]